MKRKHALASTLVLVAIVALLGPRVNVDIVLDEVMLPDNLDLYLAESEARFDDITQGTEKAICGLEIPVKKPLYLSCRSMVFQQPDKNYHPWQT